MSARALTEADLETLRAMMREEVRIAAEQIEARVRGQRVRAHRRHRAPELAAQIAREVAGPAPVDDVARAKAARALARIRGGSVR